MDLQKYIFSNIPLFFACIAMLLIAIKNLNTRKKESIYFITFTMIVFFLSIVVDMESVGKRTGNMALAVSFTSLGYITRPILLFIFILLANMGEERSKFFLPVSFSLLGANVLLNILPLFYTFEPLQKLIFYFSNNPDGTLSFQRGTFLNFFPHAVSVVFLLVLIYITWKRFQGKHKKDAFVLLLCVVFISTTVLIETLFSRSDLLNVVSEICALINYIFIVAVNTSKDSLTELYDRRTYYDDISHYQQIVNGIIEIDMNGLKYINDHFGHAEGDKGLQTIANILRESIEPKTMCAYRLSGDEFLVLMFKGKEKDLLITSENIRNKMALTNYSIAIGVHYIYADNKTNYEEALKLAEQKMYIDKEGYYLQHADIKRRK